MAPNRAAPAWRWVLWGASLASVVWVFGSVLCTCYVRSMGGFNETYGSLAGMIILLLWFYLSAMAVLLGAELNAELEEGV